MEILRKYWWCFLVALIAVPIGLNFILLIPAFTPIVGDNQIWLSFIGTLIGALASFVMIFFTAKTLEQNKEQLVELKRQWEEEHSPYLTTQLVVSDSHFMIRVINSASVVADKVKISIENFFADKKDVYNFDALQDFLKNQLFVIPPGESIYFNIWISAFKELEHLPQGFIRVQLSCSIKDFGNFDLYPSNYAFTSFEKENIGQRIVSSIEDVSKSITNKRYLFK